MEYDIKTFLSEYEDSKKTDYTKDGSKTLKDKFREIWDDYNSKNKFSHQSKFYLIQAYKFCSSDLLWKYLNEISIKIEEAKKEVKEEFKDELNNEIPLRILQLLTLLQVNNNYEKEIASKYEKIKSLENEILVLNSNIRNLKNDITEREKEIVTLNEQIAEQKALRIIDAKDEAQKTAEKYQKIANELNFVYSNFIESKDMEMSLELGEVLRDNLKEIFETLSKNGIHLGA